MAGRAHKKLLQQLETPAPEPPSSEEESESEEDATGPAAAPFNPFYLLTDSEKVRSAPPSFRRCAAAA